ncbi:hypothetical protein IQ216_06400 [Cyanobium sp. LEGE 06143]|uniref:hypothetical protein n=1 Tax=Cyanobium sp. LEGE 06143 TaxID=945727 RepID=UPI00187E5B25|nr:hypothetical protein [Cyanobium sp. LEGE 06143]MBE9172730.1 hypothetical protein [Cyanobium sp. LEGE 06143]
MPTTQGQLEQLKPHQPLLFAVLGAAASRWRGYDHWANSEGDGLLIDVHGQPFPEVRRLGEIANAIGGVEAMQEIAYGLLSGRTPFDCACLSEINVAWNGIGAWQA